MNFCFVILDQYEQKYLSNSLVSGPTAIWIPKAKVGGGNKWMNWMLVKEVDELDVGEVSCPYAILLFNKKAHWL